MFKRLFLRAGLCGLSLFAFSAGLTPVQAAPHFSATGRVAFIDNMGDFMDAREQKTPEAYESACIKISQRVSENGNGMTKWAVKGQTQLCDGLAALKAGDKAGGCKLLDQAAHKSLVGNDWKGEELEFAKFFLYFLVEVETTYNENCK